ncbi:MAG TPA: sigma-54 dependent transcriptional regulator [Terracidiphilus sp.]
MNCLGYEETVKPLDRERPHICIVSAKPAFADVFEQIAGHSNVIVVNEHQLEQQLDEQPLPDLLVVDGEVRGTGEWQGGMTTLSRICSRYPSIPVVMLGSPRESHERGLLEGVSAASLVSLLLSRPTCEPRDRRPVEEEALPEVGENTITHLDGDTAFVRCSKKMRTIESQCAMVARTDMPVLILGESGTGKEVAAKLIHSMSDRSEREFLKVNCAAMPADLLESELFGFEQGAFTGAVRSKPGKFEMCDRGTIFLDEIGEVPYPLQAKLLQVLQDGSFARLGSRTTVKVNVRVIAATNIDMQTAIAQKEFREDLYYRLNGFTVRMPPLRERVEEIPLLAKYFIRKAAARYQCSLLPISPLLMRILSKHSWPGNLRELENVIKRYLVIGDEQAIIEELNPPSQHSFALVTDDSAARMASLKHLVRDLKGNAEATVIAQTLQTKGWNRKAAAVDLQISYKALLYKIKQYNLVSPKQSGERPDYSSTVNSVWN